MTKEEAVSKVQEMLKAESVGHDYKLVIVQDLTIEKDFGWVFFYSSSKYLETRDPKYELGGNAPIIVDKRTGELHITGTAENIEYYIDRYEKTGKC